MKYLNIIESCYSDLTKSEKNIADYIKKVGKEIIYQSLQEVTQEVKVGDATVIRFCKKIGFDGFQDLKLQIATEDLTVQSSTSDSYIDSIKNNFNQAVEKTVSLIDEESLDQAIKVIEQANKVLVYGVGASGLAAQEAQASFLRVGKSAKAVIDPHFQNMESSTLTNKDALIALSLSGRTRDMHESISIAKESGATIIAITNYVLSPIAQLSDIVLSTAVKESLIEGGSLSAKISQLLIIDILTTGYALKNEELSIELKQKIAKSILNKAME